MRDEKPFNPDAIQRLLKLGGQKFALDMLNLFGSYGGKKLGEARQAMDAGNLKMLAESVHPLKSSAGNVGALRVQKLAETVEALARESKLEETRPQLAELEKAFAEVNAGLDAERARIANPPSKV